MGATKQSDYTINSDGNEEDFGCDEVGKNRKKMQQYKEEEAMDLAIAWMSLSEKNANQKQEAFWNGVVAKLHRKTSYSRVFKSAKTLFQRINRESNIYLTHKIQAEKNGSLSEVSVMILEQIVWGLFTSRTGKGTEDGIMETGTV